MRGGAAACRHDCLHRCGIEPRRLGRREVGGHDDAGRASVGFAARPRRWPSTCSPTARTSSARACRYGSLRAPKRSASASTAVVHAERGRHAVAGSPGEGRADEILIFQQEQMGVEDLRLVLACRTGDVVIGWHGARPGLPRLRRGGARRRLRAGRLGLVDMETGAASEVLGPMPMPGDAAMGPRPAVPAGRGGTPATGLVEVAPDEGGDGRECLARLPPGGGHFDLVSGRHAERGQSADAATAHAGTARGEVADGHLGVEAADRLDETGRGAGVEAVLVVQRRARWSPRVPRLRRRKRLRGRSRCRGAGS